MFTRLCSQNALPRWGFAFALLVLSILPAPAQSLVTGWGYEGYGPMYTLSPAMQRGLIQVDAGSQSGIGLKEDGTVIAWGANTGGQNAVPSQLKQVIQVGAGYEYNAALKDNGTVVAWGDDSYGQIDVPAGLNHVVKIAVGPWHMMALKSDGTAVGWPTNFPAGMTGLAGVAADETSAAVIKTDGTMVNWGTAGSAPAGLTNVVQAAASSFSSAARLSDGTCVAWGFNLAGETNVPSGLNGVISLSGGEYHYLALRSIGVTLDQSELFGAGSATGTVTLPISPIAPTDIALTSDDPSVTVPATVRVSSRRHTVDFPVYTSLVFREKT